MAAENGVLGISRGSGDGYQEKREAGQPRMQISATHELRFRRQDRLEEMVEHK